MVQAAHTGHEGVAVAILLQVERLADFIQEAAALYHVDPALVRAVVRVESAFDPDAVSTAGAQGLMQLMPELSTELGVQNPFDPRENIMAGTRYLAQLLNAYDANVELALAGYNAGPGRVGQYDGIPPFPETQRYVKAITDLLTQ
jgi:soluble lytic murein transglycosylase-like protein